MSPTTSERLTERLDRLERELRWWRRGGVAACLALAVLVTMGQVIPGAKVLEAEKFVLKDPKGKVRAVLGNAYGGLSVTPIDMRTEGQYGLHFYGADGRSRAAVREFGDTDESWQLELRAKDTPSAAYLTAGNGIAALSLRGTEQSWEVDERESVEWGKKFNAAKTPEEREKLFLSRTFNGVEADLIAFPKGTSSLRVRHGLGGGLNFYLHNRQPSLDITDKKGTSRIVLGHIKLERQGGIIEERPSASIVLFDENGKSIWKVP
jgi:hypothetical protein